MTDDIRKLTVRVSLDGVPLNDYTFLQDTVTIGAAPQADIYLEQLTPHQRARFRFGLSGFCTIVTDNGDEEVIVNDERVQHRFVYSNDIVQIGPYTLWLQVQT